MKTERVILPARVIFVIVLLILLTACGQTFQGDEFTFHAPLGSKTQFSDVSKEFAVQDKPQRLLWLKSGDLAFWADRQEIPDGSDLETVFEAHMAPTAESSSGYQFISQEKIEYQDRPAIEVIYRLFSGEWYWQRREIWVEKDGWVYTLVCSDPADATPGISIPVAEKCIELAEGFTFKE